MCRPVVCRTCNKTTWAGCGRHVDSVMKKVPQNQRCTCKREEPKAAPLTGEGLFAKLFGR